MTVLGLLIIDDEPMARKKVRRLVAMDPRYEILGEAGDGLGALSLIEDARPDVLILDITMPKIGGFELLAALPAPRPFEVIFATASDRYAIRAFEENALDYLLKPYDQARMQQALDRVVERRQGSTPTVGNPGLERLLSMHTALSTERLTVRTDEGWVAIPVEKITRLSAADKYVVISCEGKNHVARGALRTLHERLDPTLFFRVHRGDVVALSAVARIESKDHGDAVLVLHDGETVPLSRTHRSKFLAAFKT